MEEEEVLVVGVVVVVVEVRASINLCLTAYRATGRGTQAAGYGTEHVTSP